MVLGHLFTIISGLSYLYLQLKIHIYVYKKKKESSYGNNPTILNGIICHPPALTYVVTAQWQKSQSFIILNSSRPIDHSV